MMEKKSEQYYPTYNSAERDILLLEFEEAQRIANGQTKVYGQVSNVLLAIVTFSFTFFISDSGSDKNIKILLSNPILFSIIMFFLGALLLRYFVDLQKQITINARKVITLRTMLGLDYGHVQLTLPNWRVEGATNPFVIKYFYGWLYFRTMPFWILTIGINLIWFFSTKNLEPLSIIFLNNTIVCDFFWGNIIITIIYLWVFRTNLNDRHETIFLNFIKPFCFLLGIKLMNNFEYIIYRAKLSYIELNRLDVKYDALKTILVEIEDRSFYRNNGISLKSILRAVLSRWAFFRKKYNYIQSGASTITMQLARTLFIPSNQNKYLRKIAEILIALWLNSQFSKKEILDLYIASVRYERGVLGLANAIKHFFGDVYNYQLTDEESFLLVERLSNITSKMDVNRIHSLLKRDLKIKVDETKLLKLYQKLCEEKKLNE